MQIVIPAYNEERRLPRTLRELRRHVERHHGVAGAVEVIVVDNACDDATAELARDASSQMMPVRVVWCPIQGKGAAVRAGVAETDADVVAFMDADGATGLSALEDACRLLLDGADVAIGSRAAATVRHSWVRATGARAYRWCTAQIVPGVADTQCGFKVMRGDLARRAFAELRSTGFSFDVELLARVRSTGGIVEEFDVEWTDVPGSTFAPVRHGLGAFVELAGIAWTMRRTAAPRVAPISLPQLAQSVPAAVVPPARLAEV